MSRKDTGTESAGGSSDPMFFLFSNLLGCVASLLISGIITLLLLILMGWVRL